MFQFYLSSIKSGYLASLFHATLQFQFYLSSIKSGRFFPSRSNQNSFNSTLVQLKGVYSNFNGITLSRFQFYLSSIKSIGYVRF